MHRIPKQYCIIRDIPFDTIRNCALKLMTMTPLLPTFLWATSTAVHDFAGRGVQNQPSFVNGVPREISSPPKLSRCLNHRKRNESPAPENPNLPISIWSLVAAGTKKSCEGIWIDWAWWVLGLDLNHLGFPSLLSYLPPHTPPNPRPPPPSVSTALASGVSPSSGVFRKP